MALTKARYVQYTNVVDGASERQSLVHSVHDVVKQTLVNRLRQSIPRAHRFMCLQRNSAEKYREVLPTLGIFLMMAQSLRFKSVPDG